MMCDQWDVVMTNLTHIDRLKQGGQHGGQYNTSHHQQQQQQQHAGAYGRLPPHHEQPVMVSTSRSSKIAMIRAGINEVFGTLTSVPRSRFHYTWLSPFHCTTYPDIVKDDIFGYCLHVVVVMGAVIVVVVLVQCRHHLIQRREIAVLI